MAKRSARAPRNLSKWFPYVALAILALAAIGVAALALAKV